MRMLESLSVETLTKLRQAIDLAERPGGCQYVSDDKPCCVAGQFAFLQGISIQTMKDWQSAVIDSREMPYMGVDPLLLRTLQVVWDNVGGHASTSQEDLRAIMHAKLNAWVEQCNLQPIV